MGEAGTAGQKRSPGWRSSVRLRLMVLAALTVAATLTVAGILLVVAFERHLERRLGLELDTRWTQLAAALTIDGTGAARLSHDPGDPRYDQPYSGIYYEIGSPGRGEVRSRSLWDAELGQTAIDAAVAAGEPIEVDGPNGSVLYLLSKPVSVAHASGERSYTLSVAIDHAEIETLASEFAADVRNALIAIALVLLAGTWAQISLGLGPLATLRRELDLIRRGAKERMEGTFPDEVGPLVSDLNSLLDRQDDLIRKARERAGTLAHGLKTPLTIIQAEARRLQRSGATEAAKTLRDQVAAMNGHVERELSRARLQGKAVAAGHATAVADTVGRIVALERRMPRGGELDWIMEVDPRLRVRMDADDFGEVLGNLLDNARKWATGTVRIAATETDGTVSLSVDDDGPGIPADMRLAMMERGTKAGAEVEGSGLGLAIVTDVLEAYETGLHLETAPSGGLRARFEIEGCAASTPATEAVMPVRDPAAIRPAAE
ncbi:hypothetical protein ABB55_18635 [Prosthecomicrobium hirschii]|uniref:histidine kinase n=1 Tax=Prosthecodimorpha hirschii TaxID=665126 RepID=A0A0P6VT85_9HYPH|nr:HAMP domain-containing sensor histidine kinase [Prosthecomicrobium hirschii]KPL53979.1 hypothetical protein ABB55_18635 [Prosthecomicrobium hirschii]